MPKLKIILFFLALVSLYFAHVRPDGYSPCHQQDYVSVHCGKHTHLNNTVIDKVVHGKLKNHRIKAMNADLADMPTAFSVVLQVIHAEKVKTFIYSTRFYSHKCGFFRLRGPPALA